MNPSILPINFNKICRICLTESDELQSIFNVLPNETDHEEDVIYVYEVLISISSIKILNEDRMPTTLCANCLELANTSYKFQQQCNRSQIILETYRKQINNSENELRDIGKVEISNIEASDEFQDSKHLGNDSLSRSNIIDLNRSESECAEDIVHKADHIGVYKTNDRRRIKNDDVDILKDSVETEEKILNSIQNGNKRSNSIKKLQRKKVYSCSLCDKSYKFGSSLKVHMRTHTFERPYICSLCGKDFKQYGSLTYHLRSHSGEQPYKCKLCGKKYKQSGSLTTHMRVHTGQRPFLCSVCGRGFRQAPDLGYHMRTHTKEKPYMCNICGKTMSMQCHLVQHMRTHTGERPFKCTECDKAFPSSTRLKRHAIIHTGLKPYKCEVCDRSFNRNSTLRVHAKIHTDDRPHVCSVCGKGFIQLHSLKTHKATHYSQSGISKIT